MDCATYRQLYPAYAKLPLPKEIWNTAEYEAHSIHFHECASCGDWTLARRVEARGVKVEDYPCVHMAYRLTEKLDSTLDDPFDDPDVVVWQFEESGEFGLPVRDGGSSIISIQYCPWCGTPLHKEGRGHLQDNILPPPDVSSTHKPESAQTMRAAIVEIFEAQSLEASQSQYDWKVCVRAVSTARDIFERVPVEGTATQYCQAVLAALEPAHQEYFDHDGEYTSGKSSIGSVCSDISLLLESQMSGEIE